MISEKHKALINKLIAKTADKKANWSKTSREEEFKLTLEKGAITTDRWKDHGVDFIDFTIINERGDNVSSVLLTEQEEDIEDFNLLVRLHVLAKESYFKVEETIDDIYNELDSSDEVGNVGDSNENNYDDLPF